jgi:hypothetical protein
MASPAPPVEPTADPPSVAAVTLDPAPAPARGSWVSSLTIGQLGGVGTLLLVLSGGGGAGFSAMLMGADVVHQEELDEMEQRLRADLQKDRQLEMLAQEQRLASELSSIEHKLDVIARELDIDLE